MPVEHLFAGLWSWRVVRHKFGRDPMWIFAVCTICMCASPEVGGFQGGHGKVELLFGAARTVQKHPHGSVLSQAAEGLLGECQVVIAAMQHSGLLLRHTAEGKSLNYLIVIVQIVSTCTHMRVSQWSDAP